MRTRTVVAVFFALAAPAIAFVPVLAAAGDNKSDSKGAASASASGKRYDPNNVTAISKFMETCVAGNAQYAARDFAGAIATYREAIKLSPKHPLGHYLLGEAQLGANNLPEADASWSQAALYADGSDAPLRARVLFVVADVKERQKKWDDAKAAWKVYGEFVGKFDGGVGAPASGASRIQAIETMTKLNAESEKVKQRIRETADGGVFTAVSAGK